MSGIEISAWVSIGVFAITMVVVITRQYDKIGQNEKRAGKLEEALEEKIPQMLGRWEDKSEKEIKSITKAVSKLEGRMDSIFAWMQKNGRSQ